MGADVSGRGRVFVKEHGEWKSYTLGISSKKPDGTWVSAYQPIRFKKGIEVENKTDIEYKGFATAKEWTVDGKNRNYVIWQILEFRKAGDDMASPSIDEEYTKLTNDDIPF